MFWTIFTSAPASKFMKNHFDNAFETTSLSMLFLGSFFGWFLCHLGLILDGFGDRKSVQKLKKSVLITFVPTVDQDLDFDLGLDLDLDLDLDLYLNQLWDLGP